MKLSAHIFLVLLFLACSNNKSLEEKGFQVNINSGEQENTSPENELSDSLTFDTQPSNVLLTAIPNIRLLTVYKVNVSKDKKTTFIGSNNYYSDYSTPSKGNQWNYKLMPGIEALYGYNLVNVTHYNITTNTTKNLFKKPVLIRTLYYPSYSNDTLNNKPISRDYFMVSVYNEDTNKDGFINIKDLRRFYLFDKLGELQKPLIPENYSVFKSEYDPENDFMYIFAQLDVNNNGTRDTGEPIHVFWIDLKDPTKTGRIY